MMNYSALRHDPKVERIQHPINHLHGFVSSRPWRFRLRGGTGSSHLFLTGLPCPDTCTGGHSYHLPLEWIGVQAMEKSVETIVELLQALEERA